MSNTTAVAFWAASKTAPPLISKPSLAPTPQPTMTAVGVARPRAHGHATTTTLMERRKDIKIVWPVLSQTAKVRVAMAMIVGAKMEEILSAYSSIGALFSCASWTDLIILST